MGSKGSRIRVRVRVSLTLTLTLTLTLSLPRHGDAAAVLQWLLHAADAAHAAQRASAHAGAPAALRLPGRVVAAAEVRARVRVLGLVRTGEG